MHQSNESKYASSKNHVWKREIDIVQLSFKCAKEIRDITVTRVFMTIAASAAAAAAPTTTAGMV